MVLYECNEAYFTTVMDAVSCMERACDKQTGDRFQ